MRLTHGITQALLAVCVVSGLSVAGCAGPSTRVLPRDHGSPDAEVMEEVPVLEEANSYYLAEEMAVLTASPRPSGSRGESDAARYMQQLLGDYGYEVSRQRFRTEMPDGTFVTGTNVSAVKQAAVEEPEEADILIVITHHDTVAGSPGANDNASGTVIWLETARLVSRIPTDTEIRFVSFSGTKSGCLGSRYYVDMLTAKERRRVIGVLELDTLGSVTADQVVLATSDGQATMTGDMVKEACWDVLGETWQYETRRQSDFMSFVRGEMPSCSLTQARKDYGAGTPLDLSYTVDVERLTRLVDVVTQMVSRVMSTDTPSMLAKSRYMNDLRDGAFVQSRDWPPEFGSSLSRQEFLLGTEGQRMGTNTDSQSREIVSYRYYMKWFDVDQIIITDYYYADGKLDTIRLDADGAGVEFDEMKERLESWYGEPVSESTGPDGTEWEWQDPASRVRARLIPGSDEFDVELQEYDPGMQVLGRFRPDGTELPEPVTEEAVSVKDAGLEKRVSTLLEKVRKLMPEPSDGRLGAIVIYTDGVGGSGAFISREEPADPDSPAPDSPPSDDQMPGEPETAPVPFELWVDPEDLLYEDGRWRDETAAEQQLVMLYGQILEQQDAYGLARLFAEYFPERQTGEDETAVAGVGPGENAGFSLPAPDFSRSFMMFVLAERPENRPGEWMRRINFFYNSPELVTYRSGVRERMNLQSMQLQENAMTEEP